MSTGAALSPAAAAAQAEQYVEGEQSTFRTDKPPMSPSPPSSPVSQHDQYSSTPTKDKENKVHSQRDMFASEPEALSPLTSVLLETGMYSPEEAEQPEPVNTGNDSTPEPATGNVLPATLTHHALEGRSHAPH